MEREKVISGTRFEAFLLGTECIAPTSASVTEGQKAWEEVAEALLGSIRTDTALMLANLARRWTETKNPYYMDLALLLCEESGAPIPQALLSRFATVAAQRLSGDKSPGTAAKVRKDVLLNRTFEFIAHFRAAGLTLDAAVSKATQELQSVSALGLKAATIERKYVQSVWPALEADLIEGNMTAETRRHWVRRAADFSDVDEDFKGVRR